MVDTFTDPHPRGKVLGTRSTSGARRGGIDRERQIAIDNGALRFQPLIRAGWERQGIAYGPYRREPGLAFGVLLLNGHNTSQAERIEPLKERLRRWWLGSETEPPFTRLGRWLRSPQKAGVMRRWWGWIRHSPDWAKRFSVPTLDDNLALGWFPQAVPPNPREVGNGFVIHATGHQNGALQTRVSHQLMTAFKGLQNLQVYYVVILRQQGAAYYAASIPQAHGLGAAPALRPIAVDAFCDDPEVYAAVYQSVLGQISFRVDTRLYGAQVAQLPSMATWHGTAWAADALTGEGALAQTSAEVGGIWRGQGRFSLTNHGAYAAQTDSIAWLSGQQASGLIHALIETSWETTTIGLIWRVEDSQNYWLFWANGHRCELHLYLDGQAEILAVSELWHLQPNTIHALQIVDEGSTFSLYLDGVLVFNQSFSDQRLAQATGVGMAAKEENPEQYIRAFEAHARQIMLPGLTNVGEPWYKLGQEVAIADDFAGAAQPLAQRVTPTGQQVWERTLGQGQMMLTGRLGVKVQANCQQPNPGRTAYTLPWQHPHFADLQVQNCPPGWRRGQGEKGRAGLIFWQDDQNYITIN
ncbi:MAG: hypothetical protein WBA99_09695, partial [Nodosilinea sp.]